MVAIMASVWVLISVRMSLRRFWVISISWIASLLASTFLVSTSSSPSSSLISDPHSCVAAFSACTLRSTPSMSAFMLLILASRSSSRLRLCCTSDDEFLTSASMRALISARSCMRLFCSSSSSARPYVSTSSFSPVVWSSASTLPRYFCMCESIRSDVASLPLTSSSSPEKTSLTSLSSLSRRCFSASSSCLFFFAAASLALRSAFLAYRLSRYLSRCERMSEAAMMEPLTNSSCSFILAACCCSFCITFVSAPICTLTAERSPSSLPVASLSTT
mmetsp:Transcript_39003/g.95977  ORF Transcript_39003/g.95977 Transcript_39003/m.95977 type:complete len:275 (-) Transcript_39003:788-1612(-)